MELGNVMLDIEQVVLGEEVMTSATASTIKPQTVPAIQPCKHTFVYIFYIFFPPSPLFNQVGQLRKSSHLQLRPGQDKAKQCRQKTTQRDLVGEYMG